VLRLATLTVIYAAALAAAPAISGIYNAGSYLPPSLPNSGIAQGSIFTLFGSGLGPSTLQQARSYPLPTTQGLAGTTILVKVSGVTETCIMIYTAATQVAAILPSATPVGTGTLTLSYQGGSGSIAIQVVAGDFGTLTLNEGGSGPAVVTDPSYTPITMINPAHPGDTLILWGTGLGATAGDDTEPPAQPVNHAAEVEVLVGNQPATVSYGGRGGGSPGLDQINFVVPDGVNGCKTSIAVVFKGVTGNVTTTSVAPAGQSTCGDTYGVLTAANLQKAVQSGTFNIAGVELERIGSGNDMLISRFASYPVNSLIRSFAGSPGPSIGSCTVYEVMGSSFVVSDPIQPSFLDAGPQLTITGPEGTKTIDATSTGFFPATLATQPSKYIEPGSYSVSNGSGGANVGPFTWNLTLPDNVVPTNIPASIDLSRDWTLTWTGGQAFPVVSIIGYAGVPLGSSLFSYSEFVCTAAGSSGQFTIPSAILKVIPPAGYGSLGVRGVDIQLAGVPSSRFTISGSPGIDAGIFTVYESNGSIAAIQ
jgi:uncharacterized protein (TIGR03437 family)